MIPGKIITPEPRHLIELAANMRQEDIAEVWALSHMGPLEALTISVDASSAPRAWVVNNQVVTMFGVAHETQLSGFGIPWLLASTQVKKLWRPFLRGSKMIAKEWQSRYPALRNRVDARHKDAVAWVNWMGFTMKPAEPFGPDGVPFHEFEWVQNA